MLRSPLEFDHKPRGERRLCSFRRSVLPTNREVKEGCARFAPLSSRKSIDEGKRRTLYLSILVTNREMKENHGPFIFRF